VIARFHILLPFSLAIPNGEELAPYDLDGQGYRVTVHPPVLGALNYQEIDQPSTTLGESIRRIEPAAIQATTDLIQVDGRPTLHANLLRIDFHKEDFDRRKTDPGADDLDQLTHGDPPPAAAFRIANDLLMRLRTLSRGGKVRVLAARETAWRLDYLGDDESLLPAHPDFIRRRYCQQIKRQYTVLSNAMWKGCQALPDDYSAPIWDTLLLDAEAMLPEIEAAIALANSSLEVFSKWITDQLAELAKLPGGLWDWINDRGFWLKAPSVEERFDVLLKILGGGRSLRDDKALWQAFQDLRSARNKFSHEGKPLVRGKELSTATVRELIENAKRIIDWCEGLIPEALRRPKLNVQFTWTFLHPFGHLPTLPQTPGGPEIDSAGGNLE
jgi:hypothetical protein